MPETIRDVITASPRTLDHNDTVRAAAELMRSEDIGNVIVCEDGEVCGIVTDRDIAVRAVAEGKDPSATIVGDICSTNLTTVSPDDSVDEAVRLMRENALRRLPVVEGGKPIGIVAIGDLAIDLDAQSALADISSAPGNN